MWQIKDIDTAIDYLNTSFGGKNMFDINQMIIAVLLLKGTLNIDDIKSIKEYLESKSCGKS